MMTCDLIKNLFKKYNLMKLLLNGGLNILKVNK